MMKKKRIFFLITGMSLIFYNFMYGQDTLYLEDYLEVVIDNHPMIRKANLNDEITDAYKLKGRAFLDPKIASSFSKKSFDGSNYFTVWQSEVKIPTALPVDFSLGYERNNGVLLNQENNVPTNGLVYGTLNISLLKGFLFDEQRYGIQDAELKGIKTQIEKEILIREIFYQAVLAYVHWTKAENEVSISRNYQQLINNRHQNVLQLFENGDSPAIDTTESRLSLLSATKYLIKAKEKRLKALQKISLFVWDEVGNPLSVNATILPMNFEQLVASLTERSLLDQLVPESDPLIRKIDNRIDELTLSNRLEKENRKPQLDLKYNTILSLGKEQLNPSFSLNNYKYGILFLYPILNRKTRGNIALNEAKLEQSAYSKLQYMGALSNKFETLNAQREIQTDMLLVSRNKVSNSLLLYEAEQLKFGLGESSVFLLNQRERKLLEAQIELMENLTSLGEVLIEQYYLILGQSNIF